jgi:diguanylate cyclase (GGDEF)-like protein
MKILVADDDQVSLMMMRRMLVQTGYDVVTAQDGWTAVESILEENGPRLLLLDWMMPELSGPEVCKAIRTRSGQGYIYIVLLTAKDSKADLIAGLEAGADDYLTKPCHPEELRARLRTGQRVLRLEDGLVEARDEMHFRATHDALTSLLNRGAIMDALSTKLRESRAQRTGFSVLLCDVDHFKAINDTYGHPVGDQVLRELARRLQRTTNAGAVGRFGGEEFLMVFDQCGAERLATSASEVCAIVRETPFQTSMGPLQVSISAGALCVSPHDTISAPDQVLQRADLLLYQAKKEGRDRVVLDRVECDHALAKIVQDGFFLAKHAVEVGSPGYSNPAIA